MEQLSLMKNIELDKICRICLTVKKDMRPLFGESTNQLSNLSYNLIFFWIFRRIDRGDD